MDTEYVLLVGGAPCTFIFDVVSGNSDVPITVVSITDSGGAATTTVDYDPVSFGEVTSTDGIRVVVSNAAALPFCDRLSLFGDVLFSVTTMCEANPEPVVTQFSLLSI